jgi:hypothetical protein
MDSLEDVPLFSDLRYEDLWLGQRWGPLTESVVQATSDGLRGAIDASAPGAEAPLGILPLLTLRALRRALNGIIPGGVLIRQSFAVVDRLPAEGDVAIDVSISAQDRRPSGFYTTFSFALSRGAAVAAIVEWMILAP